MNRQQQIAAELNQLPDELLREVLDFARHLRADSHDQALATAQASEGSLSVDWLRPDEDEAWREL